MVPVKSFFFTVLLFTVFFFFSISYCTYCMNMRNEGAPVALWVKRWPTDLADRVRSSLEAKSFQP